MQVTDELIRNVVQEVLAHMRNGKPAPANGQAQTTRTNALCAANVSFHPIECPVRREGDDRNGDDLRLSLTGHFRSSASAAECCGKRTLRY